MNDGCSGFQLFERFFAIRQCCDAHDAGGTHGQLLDCLLSNTPQWLWPLVALCVALMIFLNPIYRRFFKRH